MLHHSVSVLTVSLLMLISSSLTMAQDTETAAWIAGDHHIHSRFSVGWNRDQEPPAPILAGDAIYPTPMNLSLIHI